MLPPALLIGLSHASRPHFEPAWLLGPVVAIAVWQFDKRGRRLAAVAAVATAASVGIVYLKSTAPEIDRTVSARSLWQQVAPHRNEVCLNGAKRDWEYGLAYYAGAPIPICDTSPQSWEIANGPNDTAVFRRAESVVNR